MTILFVARLVLAVSLFLSPSIWAQTSRGTFTGTVTDATGASVPGASVQIMNTQTGVTRTTAANQEGLYRFDAVDPGIYDVVVKSTGFKLYSSRAVPVEAAQTSNVNAQLEVGDATSTVEVSSDAVQLQTESAVRSGNISSTQAVVLPTFSRNPAMLAVTLPGVTEQRGTGSPGVATFSVNGSRGRSNNFLLDGTENNDISVAGQAFQVKIPDAVQEVSVQTSNFDAEFGRAGGAVVNIITKSGTNQIHGFAQWQADFTNDDAVTSTLANDPEIIRRGRLAPGYEQFYNAGIGGPIKRDQTFFFTSWQEQRQRATNSGTFTTPTAAGRQAIRSAFPVGVNPRADLYLDITKEVLGAGQFTTQDLGDNRGAAQFGAAVLNFPFKLNGRQSITKVDHRFSDNDLISVRYGYDRLLNPISTITLPGFATSQQNHYHNAVITETHIFSPSLTNEFRLPFNRISLAFPNDAADPRGQTLPTITMTGLTGLGVSASYPQGRVANNYIIQDTVSYIRGKHSFRFGIDLLQQRSRQTAPAFVRGNIAHTASTFGTTVYSAFANFLDDFAGTGGVSRDFGNATYYPELFRQAYFGQDRWQINSSVTLTVGLRWEDFGTPVNSLRTPAYAGIFNVKVDPASRTFTAPMTEPNKTSRDLNNFSPSLGLAFSPKFNDGLLGRLFGNGKSVIRTGYNIGYDSFFNNIASNAATSAPNLVATAVPAQLTAATPRGLVAASSQVPTVPRQVLPVDTQALVIENLRNPYYQHWSFGIQRQLPWGLVADAAYVGSAGVRLFLAEDLNPTLLDASLAVLPTGFTTRAQLQAALPVGYNLQPRFDPLQGSRVIRGNGGHSTYHSGQFQLSKRFSSDLGFNAAYTWSKMLDNSSDGLPNLINNTSSTFAVPSIFGGDKLEKGLSVYDRPYRLVISYSYLLPFFKTQKSVIGRVLGGWQVTGITKFESGVPYTVTNGIDSDGLGGAGDRPDINPAGQAGVRARLDATSPTGYVNPDVLVNGSPVPIDKKDARYVGIPAFVVGNTPRVGTAPRNSERTPGINNFDTNLIKSIRIAEGVALEFKAELYNILNHPQYGYSSPSPFTPAGGTPASVVNNSAQGRFLNSQAQLDGGGRVARYQLTLRF